MKILETQRIYFREFVIGDTLDMYQMNNDPEVLKYTGDQPFLDKDEAETFIKFYKEAIYVNAETGQKTGIGRYAVLRREDHVFIGWCGLKYHTEGRVVDLGFRFYKCYWNLGYATECAQAMIAHAFEYLQLPFLVAHSHVDNINSIRVLEKCNFERQAQISYDEQPNFLYKLKNKAYNLREIKAEETWPVRHPVLRAGRPLEDVYMEADEKESTFHLGVFYNQNIVAIASFMEDSHPDFSGVQSRLRGMAVLPEFRKKGLAELLLTKGEALLKERGRTLLWFNARIVALSFYKNLGYEIVGDEFDIPKVGPHFRMKKLIMNRRTFSKLSALGMLATSLPLQASNYLFGTIQEDELLGKGNPILTKTSAYRLRPEVAVAFEKMKEAAQKNGIDFKVVSSYRDYDHQNRIWERKYKRFRESGLNPSAAIEKIIEYSTIPGTSRHHWGTDIDIVDATPKVSGDLLVPSKFHGSGPFCKFKEWMDKNATSFGFYLVYTDSYHRKGFKYEPWHYSYKALSLDYLKEYQKLNIKNRLQTEKLLGSEHFTETFIDRYLSENVLDINPELLS